MNETAGKPVLYVEDEEDDALLLRMGFERAQLTRPLHIVTDGKEAIDYLSGSGAFADRQLNPLPCLVLLDLNLPKVSGIQVLEWISNQPQLRQLPVIVLSSSTQATDQERTKSLGAKEYLIKPVTIEKIAQMVRDLDARWIKHCPQPA